MPHSARPVALVAAILATALLAGCGKMGELERPGALSRQDGTAAPARPQDPSRPVSTVDPRDQTVQPIPRQQTPPPR